MTRQSQQWTCTTRLTAAPYKACDIQNLDQAHQGFTAVSKDLSSVLAHILGSSQLPAPLTPVDLIFIDLPGPLCMAASWRFLR